MWDLSSLTRKWTRPPALGMWNQPLDWQGSPLKQFLNEGGIFKFLAGGKWHQHLYILPWIWKLIVIEFQPDLPLTFEDYLEIRKMFLGSKTWNKKLLSYPLKSKFQLRVRMKVKQGWGCQIKFGTRELNNSGLVS